MRPTVPLREHPQHFRCHRNYSENGLPRLSEARTVLEPLTPQRPWWSPQGFGIRNRMGFYIMYNLHIKQGNIKGKYALSPKAMLFASTSKGVGH